MPSLRNYTEDEVGLELAGSNRIYVYVYDPRYLMERKLGRELLKSEEVDHIDGDKFNNTIENLQILSRFENRAKYRKQFPAERYSFNCTYCDIKVDRLVYKNKLSKLGNFCSNKCSAKYKANLLRGKPRGSKL